MFNVNKKDIVEVTTDLDVASAFVKAIDYKKDVNKKVFNIGMGKDGRIRFNDILIKILEYQGVHLRYIMARLFLEKDFKSPILNDSDHLDSIIHYRIDTLNNYYKRLKRSGKRRIVRKLLAKPIIFFKKKK